MSYISITTDFGGGEGVMRGVIWSICPDAQIADLTNKIPPQNTRIASWYIDQQAYFFPKGSVHIVVIDPGVGTRRRPIAVKAGDYYFVGPDNGVFTSVYERAEKEGWPVKVVHTNKPEYWLPKVSDIFHGRDIFSPVGAHLAKGVPIEDLGDEITDPQRFVLPKPVIEAHQIKGEVVMYHEHLGNIISNIHHEMLKDIKDLHNVEVSIGGKVIKGIYRTFGEREPGTLISLFDSTDLLMVSVVNGSAIDLVKPKLGDPIIVTF